MTDKRGDLMLTGRVTAAIELLGHSGVRDVEFAFDEEDHYPDGVLWWAKGNWSGHRIYSHHHPYPSGALEELCGSALNGGMCARCGQTAVFGLLVDGRFCCFTLVVGDLDDPQTYRYVRTCEVEAKLESGGS